MGLSDPSVSVRPVNHTAPKGTQARNGSTAALLGIVLVGWTVLYVVWQAWWVGPTVAALTALTLVVFRYAAAGARSIVVLWALLVLLSSGVLWQLAMPITIAAFLGVARKWPSLAPTRKWYVRGRVPLFGTLVVGFVTPLALGIWWVALRPDLADVVSTYVPPLPLPLLVLGGVVFVVVNATGEELLFRGIILDRLESVWPTRIVPLLIQALLFGVIHIYGVPRGAWGALMAGVWAVMLGWLRWRSGRIFAPILAHIVADASVAVVVYAASGRL